MPTTLDRSKIHRGMTIQRDGPAAYLIRSQGPASSFSAIEAKLKQADQKLKLLQDWMARRK